MRMVNESWFGMLLWPTLKPTGLPPAFVPTGELVKTGGEVSPEKWSSLNEKNSGSKSPNLLRGWQKRLVSGMLVRCAVGSNCSHFSTD